MFTTEIILRLRDRCPLLERRVAGTANFEKATDVGAEYVVPYAYVIPIEEGVASLPTGNVEAQGITFTFLTLVVVNNAVNRDDGRGYTAMQMVTRIRRELMNAMIGWEPTFWTAETPAIMEGFEDLMPNSRADTVRFRGGSLLKITDGRLWWQFEWSIFFQDGKLLNQEFDRHTVEAILEDGVAVVVDQDLLTRLSAAVVSITDGRGRVPSTAYTFDATTGTLTKRGDYLADDATIRVTYEVETPKYWEKLRKLYAGYYPDLLAQAGGDPHAITAEMYTLVNELPLDDAPSLSDEVRPIHKDPPASDDQDGFFHGPEPEGL